MGISSKDDDVAAKRVQSGPALKCPRCDSSNTKFCYYNNYSRTQPRHYCRACKRHWTNGGALRNVPVGGARKNKRARRTDHAEAEERSAVVTVPIAAAAAAAAAENLDSDFSDVFGQILFPLKEAAASSSSSSALSLEFAEIFDPFSMFSSNWN